MEFCFIRIERVKMELIILKEYQDDTHVGFFNELEEIMSSILLVQNASRYHCLYQAIGSLSQIEEYAYQAFRFAPTIAHSDPHMDSVHGFHSWVTKTLGKGLHFSSSGSPI